MNIPRVVIAGTHSGCGKSSVAAGLLRALHRRGVTGQPFKVGGDFLDAALLTAASRRPCRHLDSWMLSHSTVLELFARGADGADLAIIEGMMGLYDGQGASGAAGSTAEVARLLGAPIVLVLDIGGSARSAAATALGFSAFDPQATIAGVIAVRAREARHGEVLREALAASGTELLGVLPDDDRLSVSAPAPPTEEILEALGDAAATHIDLERLLRIARMTSPVVLSGPAVFPPMPAVASVRIGVARDDAFSFYYQDSLELLEAGGARLVPFSPLHDRAVPEVHGLYLGGGVPQAHAPALAGNAAMRRSIAAAARDGMPVLAMGGGLLYLGTHLFDPAGVAHEMAGVLPVAARVHDRGGTLNAVMLEAVADTLLLRRGETVRGYEVLDATVEAPGPVQFVLRSSGRGVLGGMDGAITAAVLASRTHLHFAASPVMAQRFVAACQDYKAKIRDRQ